MLYALIFFVLAVEPDKPAAPKPNAPARQYSFSDLPFADSVDPIGQRFYARGKIVSVKPNPTNVGDFVLRVVDTSNRAAGAYMRWVTPAEKEPAKAAKPKKPMPRAKRSTPRPAGYWMQATCEGGLQSQSQSAGGVSSKKTSAGVRKPRHARGRLLSSSSTCRTS